MVFKRKKRFKSRIMDFFSLLALFSVLFYAAAWLANHNEIKISGNFKVVDGDSLKTATDNIRLIGIDAPEFKQICQKSGNDYACGLKSRDYLRNLVGKGGLECILHDLDKYDRQLAECFSGDININQMMVESGWAVSYGDYDKQERIAQKQKRGLWAGDFDMPQQWRVNHSGLLETTHTISVMRLFNKMTNWIFAGDKN